jgi:hypothetical protein
MNKKKPSLIAHAASLVIAATCSSLPTAAEPPYATSACSGLAHGSWFFTAGAALANPKTNDEEDDDADNASGDATPVPEPQPVR